MIDRHRLEEIAWWLQWRLDRAWEYCIVAPFVFCCVAVRLGAVFPAAWRNEQREARRHQRALSYPGLLKFIGQTLYCSGALLEDPHFTLPSAGADRAPDDTQ